MSTQQIYDAPRLTRLLAAGVLYSCAAAQECQQLTNGAVSVHGPWLAADVA